MPMPREEAPCEALLYCNSKQPLRLRSAARGPVQPFSISADSCRRPARHVVHELADLARRRDLVKRGTNGQINCPVLRNVEIVGTKSLRKQLGRSLGISFRIHLHTINRVLT